ncbi:hypothetical protein CVT26_011902 [Gymnopilus dilepis]|uniref:Copper acquisition factor BIM1-like domain-containing protein n=1 Tax=Gymnopilus dilepis TaxID=231916 RepID=A0A409WNF5_9AGAR|nr:hypothetical protein CVT26_011902 [Gymnopilus dilepis]
MRSSIALLLASLAATVSAHFQLQFPPPRGPFVEDNEPKFCDNYLTPASNRSQFPLSGGFFTLNSEHPSWTAGVLLSTSANPTSFQDFSQVNKFFQVQGEGAFCIPLDLKSSNETGLTNGQNVTIQIVFDGGDGQLYQCADVTLSDSFTIPSNVSCTNATSSGSSASPTPTTAQTSPTGGSNSAGVAQFSSPTSIIVSTFMAVIGMVLVL